MVAIDLTWVTNLINQMLPLIITMAIISAIIPMIMKLVEKFAG